MEKGRGALSFHGQRCVKLPSAFTWDFNRRETVQTEQHLRLTHRCLRYIAGVSRLFLEEASRTNSVTLPAHLCKQKNAISQNKTFPDKGLLMQRFILSNF